MVTPLCRTPTAGLLLGATLAIVACQHAPRSPVPPPVGNRCAELAYVFYLVAENRDRGQTREQQVEALGESVQSPFVGEPGPTLRALERVVDAVYATPDASAAEIEDSVLLSCTVNAQGQVVLGNPAPDAAEQVPSVGSPGPKLPAGGVADARPNEASSTP